MKCTHLLSRHVFSRNVVKIHNRINKIPFIRMGLIKASNWRAKVNFSNRSKIHTTPPSSAWKKFTICCDWRCHRKTLPQSLPLTTYSLFGPKKLTPLTEKGILQAITRQSRDYKHTRLNINSFPTPPKSGLTIDKLFTMWPVRWIKPHLDTEPPWHS